MSIYPKIDVATADCHSIRHICFPFSLVLFSPSHCLLKENTACPQHSVLRVKDDDKRRENSPMTIQQGSGQTQTPHLELRARVKNTAILVCLNVNDEKLFSFCKICLCASNLWNAKTFSEAVSIWRKCLLCNVFMLRVLLPLASEFSLARSKAVREGEGPNSRAFSMCNRRYSMAGRRCFQMKTEMIFPPSCFRDVFEATKDLTR